MYCIIAMATIHTMSAAYGFPKSAKTLAWLRSQIFSQMCYYVNKSEGIKGNRYHYGIFWDITVQSTADSIDNENTADFSTKSTACDSEIHYALHSECPKLPFFSRSFSGPRLSHLRQSPSSWHCQDCTPTLIRSHPLSLQIPRHSICIWSGCPARVTKLVPEASGCCRYLLPG